MQWRSCGTDSMPAMARTWLIPTNYILYVAAVVTYSGLEITCDMSSIIMGEPRNQVLIRCILLCCTWKCRVPCRRLRSEIWILVLTGIRRLTGLITVLFRRRHNATGTDVWQKLLIL
jgi:hypothetical protein